MPVEHRSKYVFLKTILDPDDRSDGAQCLLDVLAANSTGWSIVWARHDHAETGPSTSPTHFHAVIRFASTECWDWLFIWLHNHDGHEYCAAGRGWQRCVPSTGAYNMRYVSKVKHKIAPGVSPGGFWWS